MTKQEIEEDLMIYLFELDIDIEDSKKICKHFIDLIY